MVIVHACPLLIVHACTAIMPVVANSTSCVSLFVCASANIILVFLLRIRCKVGHAEHTQSDDTLSPVHELKPATYAPPNIRLVQLAGITTPSRASFPDICIKCHLIYVMHDHALAVFQLPALNLPEARCASGSVKKHECPEICMCLKHCSGCSGCIYSINRVVPFK